jgi:hypothetical protein
MPGDTIALTPDQERAGASVCSECSSDAKCGKCISCDRTARNAERPRPDRSAPVPA